MTPQAVSRFVARFGDRVAVLHSRLRAGERRDEWHRLRAGEARICVGPRSAVFAPIAGLGLIVVDEEHDASYKQEGDPRYDAREVARAAGRRGRRRARLRLGDAAARELGRAGADRAARAGSTAARCRRSRSLDMRGRDGRAGPLHPRTREALAEVGERRRQGDRADQPPRLGAASALPRLRLGWRVSELRRLAGRPRVRARACAATTAATPSRCPRRAPSAAR